MILVSFGCLLIICLVIFQTTSSFGLSEEGQKILNKYQEYKDSGYAPIPNKKSDTVQVAQQNVPTTKSNSPPPQSTSNRTNVDFGGFQTWLIAGIILIIIVGVIVGSMRGGSRPWGSYSNPPSMKQLWRLRESGYDGPMPTSSREAHERISDIERGGDGNIERYDEDDDYDNRRYG